MKQRKTLKQAYPDFKTNGIFTQLSSFDVPWKDVVSSKVLNLDYYGNHSGNKLISPLVETMLADDDALQTEDRNDLAELLFAKYSNAWKKEWDAIVAEYNPLDNFKRTYEETYSDTKKDLRIIGRDVESKDTGDITTTTDNTGTQQVSGEDTTNITSSSNNDTTTNSDIYGFDSSNPSNADVSRTNETLSGTNNSESNTSTTRTDNLQEVSDVNRNLTYTSEENTTDDRTGNNNGSRSYTSAGNIGVATFQEQLNAELRLRFDWTYFNIIYKNIDDVLAINIYSMEV